MGQRGWAVGPKRHIFGENICVIYFADLEYFLFRKKTE
jgi:hypothetical protein